MSIQTERLSPQSCVVHINGRLDQNQTPELEDTLSRLIEEDTIQIIVNLSDATYINSGGLRSLVSTWRKVKLEDGNLVLCGLNERLQEIFSMIGFDKVFKIYPSIESAIGALTLSDQ